MRAIFVLAQATHIYTEHKTVQIHANTAIEPSMKTVPLLCCSLRMCWRIHTNRVHILFESNSYTLSPTLMCVHRKTSKNYYIEIADKNIFDNSRYVSHTICALLLLFFLFLLCYQLRWVSITSIHSVFFLIDKQNCQLRSTYKFISYILLVCDVDLHFGGHLWEKKPIFFIWAI